MNKNFPIGLFAGIAFTGITCFMLWPAPVPQAPINIADVRSVLNALATHGFPHSYISVFNNDVFITAEKSQDSYSDKLTGTGLSMAAALADLNRQGISLAALTEQVKP